MQIYLIGCKKGRVNNILVRFGTYIMYVCRYLPTRKVQGVPRNCLKTLLSEKDLFRVFKSGFNLLPRPYQSQTYSSSRVINKPNLTIRYYIQTFTLPFILA